MSSKEEGESQQQQQVGEEQKRPKGSAGLVACCGLYCGVCRSLKSGDSANCSCATNESAAKWCGIRNCCKENGYKTCAECTKYADPVECPTFHTLIGRIIGYCFGSDRAACIRRIKEIGLDAFADEMAEKNLVAIKKTSWNPFDW